MGTSSKKTKIAMAIGKNFPGPLTMAL